MTRTATARQRDIRRLAMQVLYQMDVGAEPDLDAIFSTMDEEYDPTEVRERARTLASDAWAARDRADALATELAPTWPTHRQPPVDRAILRLAWHEMSSGRTPVKVTINEAIELAKAYGAKESAPFINGVLDKMARRLPVPEPEIDRPE
ncbi:MAG: transcription antitermination factor NusB [Phycisphaeraceae bacterium]|nr:transcription antitermination factor NusB [Phycisphaeraceae bacterium]